MLTLEQIFCGTPYNKQWHELWWLQFYGEAVDYEIVYEPSTVFYRAAISVRRAVAALELL